MIKSSISNKISVPFLVSILLISLFVSTPSLASEYSDSYGAFEANGEPKIFKGYGSFQKESEPSPSLSPSELISPQFLLAGAVTVFAVGIPVSKYVYSSFQSWWNKKENVLENFS